MTLFRRLFLTYAAVVGLAVAVLVLAPIKVSVPTALAELAVILVGFAVTLVLFHAFLRRALAPLQTLTEVMHQIDPLAPGQRIDATTGDEEVVALAEAFNDMLDRLEGERRDSGRRALAAQEAERRRIARELHEAAGTQDLVEVHGSISHSSCLECGRRYELEETRGRLAADERGVPRCDCGHPLKPDVVLFGEFLPMDAMGRAEALCERADLLLCVGSSLEVYPVAGLPSVCLRAGGALAIVTKSETKYDDDAAVRLTGDVVAELEAVVAAL